MSSVPKCDCKMAPNSVPAPDKNDRKLCDEIQPKLKKLSLKDCMQSIEIVENETVCQQISDDQQGFGVVIRRHGTTPGHVESMQSLVIQCQIEDDHSNRVTVALPTNEYTILGQKQ